MRVKKGRGDEWKNIYSAEKAESMLREQSDLMEGIQDEILQPN